MGSYLLRVEAVNFAATLDDTANLSTIRGSSLAMLRAERFVRKALDKTTGISAINRVFAGASQSAFTFTAANDTDAETAAKDVRAYLNSFAANPCQHLSFVVDAAPADGGDALDVATARNRSRQFRQWTVVLPEFAAGARGPDTLDKTRPATRNHGLPGGSKPGAPSVIDRREYGQNQRQAFLEDETGLKLGTGLRFADSFADLVAHPPSELPVSLKSKMAVFYADGNKFGGIRDKLIGQANGDSAKAIGDFSGDLVSKQRDLLRTIMGWFRRGITADKEQLNRFGAFNADREHVVDYRIETLLWGGDEIVFVMPCWLAMDFLAGFFAATKNWKIKNTPLTFSAGLVICHHKVPIRQARHLAKELAETCKSAMDPSKLNNAASIAVFESLSLPETGLGGYRAGLYGTCDGNDETKLARSLILPGEKIGALINQIGELKGHQGAPEDGFPRSQLYKLLRMARTQGGFFNPKATSQIRDAARVYAANAGSSNPIDIATFALPGIEPRPTLLTLALAAELWSYAKPFDMDLPRFLEAGA